MTENIWKDNHHLDFSTQKVEKKITRHTFISLEKKTYIPPNNFDSGNID